MDTDIQHKQKIELRFNARFTGRMSFSSLSKNMDIHPEEIEHLIEKLNYSDADEEIADRLRDRLQIEGLEIDARIRFHEGSIEWDGVLYVLNWMAVVGGTVGLVDYLRKIIMSVINTTIKKRLPKPLRHEEIKTTVFVEEEIISPISAPAIYQQPSMPAQNQSQAQYPTAFQAPDESITRYRRLIIGVTLFNSALIGALILVVILMLTSTRL
ncbi:MAG: hypothetical protein ABW168_03035 [Sedimenticola sp.]